MLLGQGLVFALSVINMEYIILCESVLIINRVLPECATDLICETKFVGYPIIQKKCL